MSDIFDKAHAFVARWEGGYTNHPNDPGGPTNYGISLRFLQGEGLDVGDLDMDGDIDIDDIRMMTPEDAKRIFKHAFWDKMRLDEVKPLCAFVVYDTAVNMGMKFARQAFQRAVGIKADGIWGPISWDKLRTCTDKKAALAMLPYRRAYYVNLAETKPTMKVFLKGWLNRVNSLEKTITAM